MINKKQSRLRRARATRARILLQKVDRLTVHRTNLHIYASIISADNAGFGLHGRTRSSRSARERFRSRRQRRCREDRGCPHRREGEGCRY